MVIEVIANIFREFVMAKIFREFITITSKLRI